MMGWNRRQDAGVKNAIVVVLKIWACVTLFMTANLIKTLLAKLLASKFNKESHARKIQDSLIKEYYLHMLLQPRQRSEEGSVDGRGEGEGLTGADGTGEGPGKSVKGQAEAFGTTLASSMRGVASSVFGLRSTKPVALKSELGTASEELLHDDDRHTPSPSGAVTVDINIIQRRQHAEKHGHESHQGASLQQGSLPHVASAPPPHRYSKQSTQGPAMSRAGSVGSRGRSSWPHSIGEDRRASQASGRHASFLVSQPHRAMEAVTEWCISEHVIRMHLRSHCTPLNPCSSPLVQAPVMEVVAEDPHRRGLTANQLAKMEMYIRRQALQVRFVDELNATERQEEVTSEAEAKKMAFYLFWNVKADLERPYIILDDVADFLPPGEAEEAFTMLDRNGNGRVTLQECVAIVLSIYEARCDLAMSLKDTKSVVRKLEHVIGVAVHTVFVFLYMVVFQVDVIKTYLALSSLVLAFSFVFQNSIRTVSSSYGLLFMHSPRYYSLPSPLPP